MQVLCPNHNPVASPTRPHAIGAAGLLAAVHAMPATCLALSLRRMQRCFAGIVTAGSERLTMMKTLGFFLLLGLASGPAAAQEADLGADDAAARAQAAAEFEASLDFKRGTLLLPNGIATLEVPEGFRYVGPDDARRVLEEGWGNPDGHGTLGMLFPVDVGVVSAGGWGVVITYEEDGHVSDEDADRIDYDAMLASMRSAIAQENEARERAGYAPLELIGWAARPRYDKAAKKLYWAKALKFGDAATHTLNYNIRILGRKGVLVMNAVAGIEQMARVEQDMQQVLAFTNFVPGQRYADYDAATDKLAAYGLGALVAGGVAAKTGLLAKLVALAVAFKKLLIVGGLLLAALAARFLTTRRGTPA
jgi:uncharacterized membrane-anchored protein